MSALFSFQNVAKAFHRVPVLRGVTLRLEAGEILGLVGGNGAGKSTLMNLAGGNLTPDDGTMTWRGQPWRPLNSAAASAAGIAFVHQELNLFPNLTLAENLFLAAFPAVGPFIHRGRLAEAARLALERVGLGYPPETLLGRLSPGERQLVEIAKALQGRPDLMILDEPTTSLSPPECSRLFALVHSLAAEGCAIVFISHALGDVLRICHRVAVLRDGVLADEGRASTFDQARLLAGMAGREIRQLFPDRPETAIQAGPLLEVRSLCQPHVIREISFTLGRGEILGLSGLMGAGRTELARILFGLEPSESGEVWLDGKRLTGGPGRRIQAGMALLTESRSEDGICAEGSVEENIALVTLADYVQGPARLIHAGLLRRTATDMGRAVGLTCRESSPGTMQSLSGGNQQKAVLARWLLSRPKLLILDEPTRGIDAAAKFEIYQLILRLAAEGAGVLLISSEVDELTALSDRILVMSRGRLAGEFKRPHFDPAQLLAASFHHHQTTMEVPA